MIGVLIVDDEVLIRIGLKSTIDWEGSGFTITGLASSGEQALKIFDQNHPEIVITDIRMPGMDGIELIKLLKQRNKNVKIIILSYYEDLKIVKESLRLGAMDYVLKMDMEPEELHAMMIKAKEQIEEERDRQNQFETMKQKFEMSKTLMEETFLIELVKGVFSKQNEIDRQLLLFNADFAKKDLALMFIQSDNYNRHTKLHSIADCEFLKKTILSIIKEVVIESGIVGLVCHVSMREFVCLTGFDNKQGLKDINSKVFFLAEKIKLSIEKFSNFTVTIGISDVFPNMLQTEAYYIKSRAAAQYKLFSGVNSIYFYNNYASLEQPRLDIEDIKEQLRSNFKNGNVEGIEFLLAYVLLNILPKTSDVILSNLVSSEILQTLKEIISDTGRSFLDICSEEEGFLIEDFETLTDRYNWLIRIAKTALNEIEVSKVSRCGPVVKKVIAYLHNNYKKEISLLGAAQYVNISNSYLSRLFKDETGENFIEYLNRIRVEKAKKLIFGTDLRTYEIAYQIGMDNVRYFNQIFKKQVGMTPTEYRSKHKKGG